MTAVVQLLTVWHSTSPHNVNLQAEIMNTYGAFCSFQRQNVPFCFINEGVVRVYK